MSALLQALTSCLCGSPSDYDTPYPNEKLALLSHDGSPDAEEVATQVVDAMISATDPIALRKEIKRILPEVSTASWTSRLAEWILHKLENFIKNPPQVPSLLKTAYEKACAAVEATEGFARDHPVWTAIICTVIALGILVTVGPWALEALGFAELGPVEGSWAALWQSRYVGFVPKGSLFSYFQRLGMVWH